MRRTGLIIVLLAAFCLLGASIASAKGDKYGKEEAMGVINRFAGENKLKVKLIETGNEDGLSVYEFSAKKGVITIKGSNGIAWCRGFYDLVKTHDAGISSWSGVRCDISRLPADIPAKRVVAPFRHYFYFNPVTYGYSLPYWDWTRWEREIDWMALHGIDMPLALVANEAISARVWKKMGLTDEEIREYFTGPAHLPWMRMGNASSIDPGLTDDWHNCQVALQHKILERMRILGMKPICPGFAGMVPKSFERLYPDLNLIETNWVGFRNWMIDPEEELFIELGKAFIEEWEKEFGTCDYYLADSFNEMEIPFHPHGDDRRYEQLSSYGDRVYNSIKAGNPDAVWVMQGWMFGFQRNIWDSKSLAALLSRVPDDKMLLLDMAVDYNKNFWHSETNWDFFEGFYNKPWIYSTIPNMGGKTGMTGILPFYANGHLEAINSPNKGRLVGYGTAPEGIENNEVIYELVTDAGWSKSEIDLGEWLEHYSRCRYGDYSDEIAETWDGLLKSVYGTFTDHPRFNWQFRPGRVRKGSITINDELFEGVEAFCAAAPQFGGSELYRADLIEYTAMYVGAKLDILAQLIYMHYDYGEFAKSEKLESQFIELMEGMDTMLESHPNYRFSRWIDWARGSGDTPELQDYYEKNARRLLTIWGPPIDDYSARLWSGLIRDYYLPRWKFFFSSRREGVAFPWNEWEREWVEERRGLSAAQPSEDPVALALSLVESAKGISLDNVRETVEIIGTWSRGDVGDEWQEMIFPMSVTQLREMKAIRFNYLRGRDKLMISEVEVVADGVSVAKSTRKGETGVQNFNNVYMFDIPEGVGGNNECYVKAMVRSTNDGDSNGVVELITSIE